MVDPGISPAVGRAGDGVGLLHHNVRPTELPTAARGPFLEWLVAELAQEPTPFFPGALEERHPNLKMVDRAHWPG
ncbi:hypothetical protein GCM10010052_40730 [Paenarthrobacter histidinolovorans]|nr:hypothetical protein GCM10010052_40730 [Paenarthrobacter histidinolovorans]